MFFLSSYAEYLLASTIDRPSLGKPKFQTAQEKQTQAYEKLKAKEEKKKLKEIALAAGPKRRGRKPKETPAPQATAGDGQAADTSVDTTLAEKGTPNKAPKKRLRRCATATADAGGSAGASAPPAGDAVLEPQETPVEPSSTVVVDPKASKGNGRTAKRQERAKLALQKLADNMGSMDTKELYLPGPEFSKITYTIPAPSLVSCSVGVLLDRESFYVYKKATIPQFLEQKLQVCLQFLNVGACIRDLI